MIYWHFIQPAPDLIRGLSVNLAQRFRIKSRTRGPSFIGPT
ncbi:MAG: hypothetical protein AAF317_20900 [Pseudomonadota bacterium]